LVHGFLAMLSRPDIAFPFGDDIFINYVPPVLRQYSLVSLVPLKTRACFRAANVGNPHAANVNQVLRGEHSHRYIVNSDKVSS
jgi:hypothetical protein